MNGNNSSSGTLAVILAGFCWGVISLFVRRLTALGFDSLSIMLVRSSFSVIMLSLFFLIKDRSLFRIKPRDLWLFAGTGLLSLTFFSYCYFSSIVRSGAAVAVVLLYTSPIFVMLMSAVVFHEKITRRKLIALVMTFTGCVLVAGLVGSGAKLSIGALLLGLGSGFGYALYSIFAGLALKRGYSSLTVTFYTLLLSGVSLLFLTDTPAFTACILAAPPSGWLCMAGIALICTVIPYIAYTAGLSRMEAGRAAVLVTVEPLVGTLLGILVYKESADFFTLLGIALIFTAVELLSLPEKMR